MPRAVQRMTQRRSPRPRDGAHRNVRNPSYRTATVYSGTANNTGVSATAPTITIAGPVAASTVYFENATAGKTVWINITVGSGQTLSVDFSTRVVTLAGVTQTGVVSIDSRWWDLAAGNNTIRSNVAATVTWRPAYTI